MSEFVNGVQQGAAGGGDVTGPSSSVDNAIARFDSTTGKLLQDYTSSAPTITDGGVLQLNEGQLAFPATVNPSSDGNTLDDYEEGTWIPGIADNDGDGSGESQVYVTQVGTYTKVGNKVTITGTLITSSIGSLTTTHAARIVGLPFTAKTTANHNYVLALVGNAGLALPVAQDSLEGQIASAAAYLTMRIWESTAGVNALLISEFSADGNVSFTGSYEV